MVETWEYISIDEKRNQVPTITSRLKVPGGWLYRVTSEWGVSLAFVPILLPRLTPEAGFVNNS